MNGSVANDTIRTIPKLVGKTNECFNEENSSPFALSRTTPINDGSTKVSPRQNNIGFQSDEIPVLNNLQESVDLEQAKPISQNATAYNDKLAPLQNKNHNFAPLRVECDPVSNSLINIYLKFLYSLVCTFLSCTFFTYNNFSFRYFTYFHLYR